MTATLLAAGILGWSARAHAQFNVLHEFPAPGATFPTTPLVRAADGNYYGTTYRGGASNVGTIFRMTPAGTVTILHEFDYLTGGAPSGGLIQADDGNLYGMTQGSGSGNGVVFRITLAGALTVVHGFEGGNQGQIPIGALVQAGDGNFYGVTQSGGASGFGTIFRVTPAGMFTLLHSFDGGAGGGASPYAGVVQASDGNFYGTTNNGGTNDTGTVYRMTPAGVVTILHAFVASGGHPRAALIQTADANLYGTTFDGGTGAAGTAFSITLAGTLTTIHSFAPDTEGGNPSASLLQAPDGHLYGTAESFGASNRGTVFRMTTGGALTVLHTFTGATGGYPLAALVRATDGSFYGTTGSGGVFNAGTAFQVTSGGAHTLLRSFSGGTGGATPYAPLTVGADGNLYGTTSVGGTANLGTFFKATPAGAVSLLHSFAQTADDGAIPGTAVVQASDGNFYGTSDNPTDLYRVAPDGTFTRLHFFSRADGVFPSSLIQGLDGHLYGVTAIQGPSGAGTIYRMTLAGAFTVLHAFGGGAQGSNATAALLQASDGNFYGTTNGGGSAGFGTVYRITPAGSFAIIHSFTGGSAGAYPAGGSPLIQGPAGMLYGVTNGGGAQDLGTVYKISTAGSGFAVVHAFTQASGQGPQGLLFAPDGNFYGTTRAGGALTWGTIYRMTPDGTVTVLHDFNRADGSHALGLVRTRGWHFYGTATYGGAADVGLIFHLSAAPLFTDDPLIPHVTPIRAVHITELRARIDALRSARGLSAFSYTDPSIVAGSTTVKAQHILDLRESLRQIYVNLGVTPPAYSALILGALANAASVTELRSALVAVE